MLDSFSGFETDMLPYITVREVMGECFTERGLMIQRLFSDWLESKDVRTTGLKDLCHRLRTNEFGMESGEGVHVTLAQEKVGSKFPTTSVSEPPSQTLRTSHGEVDPRPCHTSGVNSTAEDYVVP